MARFGMIGGSYPSQSVNASAERTINWIPEANASPAGKSAMSLMPTPGLRAFGTFGGITESLFTINGRGFGASAALGILKEFRNDGALLNFGSLASGGHPELPARMCASPTQLFIVASGRAVVLDLTQSSWPLGIFSFTEVTQQLQGVPIECAYCDGYFFVLFQNSQKFQISNLLDATTWNAANVAQISVFPDNVIAMIADHREVWFASKKNAVAYYNSGNPDFPFQPILSSFIEHGIVASYAGVRMDNSIFWLEQDEIGAGIARRAQGYVPTRISTHEIEYTWNQYPTISDVFSFSYQDSGHSFWVLYFPSGNATWVYDAASQLWHERTFSEADGTQSAWLPRCHMYCFGKHIVGSRKTGVDLSGLDSEVFEMSTKYADDLGGASVRIGAPPGQGIGYNVPSIGHPIVRVRRAPHVSTEQKRIRHSRIQIDVETGLAAVAPDSNLTVSPVGYHPTLLDGLGNPRDAQMMVRWSDDGGHSWKNERIISLGAPGQYKKRAILRRLGQSRDRVYEIKVSDPIPARIINAYLFADPGFQPQESLSSQLRKVGV